MSVLGLMREPSGAYWITGSLLTAVSMICTPRNTVDNANGSCEASGRAGSTGASESPSSAVACAARNINAAVLEMRDRRLMRPIQRHTCRTTQKNHQQTSKNV